MLKIHGTPPIYKFSDYVANNDCLWEDVYVGFISGVACFLKGRSCFNHLFSLIAVVVLLFAYIFVLISDMNDYLIALDKC
jgi:hypothetical protein